MTVRRETVYTVYMVSGSFRIAVVLVLVLSKSMDDQDDRPNSLYFRFNRFLVSVGVLTRFLGLVWDLRGLFEILGVLVRIVGVWFFWDLI